VIIQPTSDRMCVLRSKRRCAWTSGGGDFFADALDRVRAEGWVDAAGTSARPARIASINNLLPEGQ